MRLLRPLPDLQIFTPRDYEVISTHTPPGKIVQYMCMLAHRLRLGDMGDTVDVSYLRAENNSRQLMERPDLPDHVRGYLEKFAFVR